MASKAKSNNERAPQNFGVLEVKSCPVHHRRHVHQIDKSGREFCCSSGKEVVEKTNQNAAYQTNFDSRKEPTKS